MNNLDKYYLSWIVGWWMYVGLLDDKLVDDWLMIDWSDDGIMNGGLKDDG